jgi:hypothetical protein
MSWALARPVPSEQASWGLLPVRAAPRQRLQIQRPAHSGSSQCPSVARAGTPIRIPTAMFPACG